MEKSSNLETQDKRLVVAITGGNGFLASATISLLQERAASTVAQIIAVDIVSEAQFYEDHPACSQKDQAVSITYHKGDITKLPEVLSALDGVDLVFHMCSCIHTNPSNAFKKKIFKVNVEGTKNVIEACKVLGIRNIVYSSSISANRMFGNEDDPPTDLVNYTDYCGTFYGFTKKLAETLVLEANGAQIRERQLPSSKLTSLTTCSLRVATLYGGKGDLCIGKALEVAQKIKGCFPKIGWNPRPFPMCYYENAAWAHVCAMESMVSSPETIAGKMYYVTDNSPYVGLFNFFEPYFLAFGYTPVRYFIPLSLAYYPLLFFRWVCQLLGTEWFTSIQNPDVLWYTYYSTHGNSEEFIKDTNYKPIYSAMESFDKSISCYLKEYSTIEKSD